ncbi:tannase/feruloyl esterase family alpha/beta hydrolase [Massilia sp. LjRoot122]|uniref:tannase/feruloyl esterase family alpha/beta hydrolase n=1 Tax=Massilia sp. LjRoot122 TaxID=3342257 RepID=UPI003ECE86B7
MYRTFPPPGAACPTTVPKLIVFGVAAVFASGAWGQTAADGDFAARCAALGGTSSKEPAKTSETVELARFIPAGAPAKDLGAARPLEPGVRIPAHCELIGRLEERTGADGQAYAIRYHLRLPQDWNGGFFFQGGGGTNGDLGDALGNAGGSMPPVGLALGYAVLSQDSGHDNGRNDVPERGGRAAFGADAQARENYAHASLARVSGVAKKIIARFYGNAARRSYFVGCSKGGQEGMALAQKYPREFDGIIAAAPAFSVPRAALAQAWDVQSFAALVRDPGAGSVDQRKLPAAFSNADLATVNKAVLRACDADDGLEDGIVGAFEQCTTAKVKRQLDRATCSGGKSASCLSKPQVSALLRSMEGPRGKNGEALYTSWHWDGGIGSTGWRRWKLGDSEGPIPALNVVTGGSALAMLFSVPPTPVRSDPQSLLDYQMGFDMSRDANIIYATSDAFPRSSWDTINARSPDLATFRARGGKMIVPHGVSDPVFSIKDTLDWYREVNQRHEGRAADFVRVFPVPGMAHCSRGPATDRYNAFAALVEWVERGDAPEAIIAQAGPGTPWPGRTRPLCAYPQVARYAGSGDKERAESFVCSDPKR